MSNCIISEHTCALTMIDPETNKELSTFNSISEIDLTRNIVEECYDNKEHRPIITKDERVLSFTSDTSEFHPEVFAPEHIHILATKRIQVRKHHKKRINKKWSKRYGYREQSVDFGNWNYRATDKFGEYEFERKII